jgi:DNA-binding IclR family transcriptional regulator
MMVSGVGHAGEILDLFTPQAPEWGATDAARKLGISKSHTHRLLASLAQLGLLERQASTRRYRLGRRWLVFASVLLETDALIANAVPIMRSLSEQLDLDAALAVWDRGGVLCLRPSADRCIVRCAPGDCVALATVLLAGRPDSEIDAVSHIARRPAIALDAGAPDELLGRLERVRAGGLIGDFRPGNGGACHLAAPIFDAAGSVVAALSVQTPRARWHARKHEFIRALRDAARRLTASVAVG